MIRENTCEMKELQCDMNVGESDIQWAVIWREDGKEGAKKGGRVRGREWTPLRGCLHEGRNIKTFIKSSEGWDEMGHANRNCRYTERDGWA